MKYLSSLNKYFVKYKWRLILGLLFVAISSKFAVMSGGVVQDIIDKVERSIQSYRSAGVATPEPVIATVFKLVLKGGLILVGLALLRGFFMFMMRQTIIVMSRHIEYDQKNEIYNHYQQLDTHFFKTHFTGDLMNRISEDVSRVRMYTGPSIMYFASMLALTIFCVWDMIMVNPMLTLYVLAPFPFLVASIYYVNRLIFRKSSKIQAQLSGLTATAQESYSGIRIIKSFVQEKTMLRFFNETSEEYRKSAINLSLTEAIYFPTINLFIGISFLTTILIGGYFAIHGQITTGNIAQFVIYINLLMFPISSIGMVVSMTQRAGASQKRIDEFLHSTPEIVTPANAVTPALQGKIDIDNVSFTYEHTGITALQNLSLHIKAGDKVTIIGKTGSGKSSLAQILLRMYDVDDGSVKLDDTNIKEYHVRELRKEIAYAPQEAFLFSDTIYNNIRFGTGEATEAEVKEAARLADLEKDIAGFEKGYETVIGERGVMLSGGQKQRMVLARALLKKSKLLILDDCLSAVDTQTEKTITSNLVNYLEGKTAIIITHRIFSSLQFDQIIVMDKGSIAEHGTHDELMQLDGRYAKLYRHQTTS